MVFFHNFVLESPILTKFCTHNVRPKCYLHLTFEVANFIVSQKRSARIWHLVVLREKKFKLCLKHLLHNVLIDKNANNLSLPTIFRLRWIQWFKEKNRSFTHCGVMNTQSRRDWNFCQIAHHCIGIVRMVQTRLLWRFITPQQVKLRFFFFAPLDSAQPKYSR